MEKNTDISQDLIDIQKGGSQSFNLIHLVIPPKGRYKCYDDNATSGTPIDDPNVNDKDHKTNAYTMEIFCKIIKKALGDETFKRELLDKPNDRINSFLETMNLRIPADTEFKVIEDSDDRLSSVVRFFDNLEYSANRTY
jgi:hypothetical protein